MFSKSIMAYVVVVLGFALCPGCSSSGSRADVSSAEVTDAAGPLDVEADHRGLDLGSDNGPVPDLPHHDSSRDGLDSSLSDNGIDLDATPDGMGLDGGDVVSDEVVDTIQPGDLDSTDSGADDSDSIDPAVPLAGFGVISGECGVIDVEEILSASSSLFVNHLDFGSTPFSGDLSVLSPAAQEVYTDGNAGGSSAYSETFSCDVLYRCELAQLLKTENEIVYDTAGDMTDILLSIDGYKVAVSVVRAQSWPLDGAYSESQATSMLVKKLGKIEGSTANVSAEDKWEKQILHVIAYGEVQANSVVSVWNAFDSATKGNTILYVTVTDGSDLFIYTE